MVLKEKSIYNWVSWETSTRYLITKWNGPGTLVRCEWVKKENIILV